MARRRYSRKGFRRSKSFTLPIAPILGLAVGLATPIEYFMSGDIRGGMNHISIKYLGYNMNDGQFRVMDLMGGLVPLVLGVLIHKFVGGKLGLNKVLASAGVPIIRI